MTKANIVTAVLVVIVTIAAIVGVVYGVTTHTEQGFAEGAPRWPAEAVPLRVCGAHYVESDAEAQRAAQRVVERAVDVINGRLGFEMLRMSNRGCDVRVTVGVPAEPGWMDPGGDALLTITNGGVSCDARTSNVHGEILSLVVQRELGHCLGLMHDDFGTSIMRPEQSETQMGEFPPRLTDYDRDLLRRAYER